MEIKTYGLYAYSVLECTECKEKNQVNKFIPIGANVPSFCRECMDVKKQKCLYQLLEVGSLTITEKGFDDWLDSKYGNTIE